MATVREGRQSVLMVVDAQVGVMAECWDAPRVVANVARAVERARAARVPVLWVQHDDDENLRKGSNAWQWVPELTPLPGDVRIYKRHNSAFESTPLDSELAALGATHVVLSGAATNWCIRATAYGALDRGYDLTLVADGHTTGSMPLEDGTTIKADHVVRELNLAMTWLSYPGRKNASTSVDALAFEEPSR
jgi:nicotinamidase-related amidase